MVQGIKLKDKDGRQGKGRHCCFSLILKGFNIGQETLMLLGIEWPGLHIVEMYSRFKIS